MASYTNSLRLTLPVTGTEDGTWGDTVNNGITTLIDTSIAGTAAITMTAADYTLTNNSGATDEARSMFITLGGTPGASFNVICPTKSKLYFVKNSTAFAQTFKTLGGTGISIPNSGAITVLYCDGTNVVDAVTRLSSLTLATALAITSGGTGQTTATAAFNALAPTQTSNTGKYLTTDGATTSWAPVVSGATISNDTTTATNVYPMFSSATSGTPTTVYTSDAKLLYKPSTGEFQASELVASNGIFVNTSTVSASYTIASGYNAMSVGPVTVASGQSVTVTSGQRWVVL